MITIEADACGGSYYMIHMQEPASRMELAVEAISNLDSFVCSYREEPFFMSAKAGSCINDIPKETQWLGVRHTDGSLSVYFSMAFETCRTALYGKDGSICVVALTGDDCVQTDTFCAFYKISGTNFYELVETAARNLRERYQTCRLRTEKPVPEMLDLFGWCTWDSFYDQVKSEDIPVGLESFHRGGLVPKLLILDDGWQTTSDQELPRGQWKLSDIRENKKFAPSLKETVIAAKDCGVEKFFVWHAILGYWGGVAPASPAMAKYGPVLSKAVHTEEIKEVNPTRWENEHFDFGMIDPDKAAQFYDDYHAYLKSQGVDGVKVDVQSSIEAHANGLGGRVRLSRTIREGLERSVQKHFGGALINCMSNANDMVYHCKDSNLMRSSNDFFPDQPLSHSEHIYRNAVNSIWLSQFTWCDWDMFQTSHPYGAYHAAARAISGGPVYVSDRVDEHDFALIRALTDRDGKVLRANHVGLPTLDCLFSDPRTGKSLYKIFNRNAYSSVVGVFSFGGAKQSIRVSPADVQGNTTGSYAVYSHKTGKNIVLTYEESLEVSLEGVDWDIVTISKIDNGIAVIGLTGKLNCGGAVKEAVPCDGGLHLKIADHGQLLIYTVKEGFRTVIVPSSGEVTISC